MGKLLIALFILSFPIIGMTQDFGRAEYFFDSDPGAGNGISLVLSSTSTPLVFTSSIPTTSLTTGFHHLSIRVKEAGGPWGLFESRGFYISVATTSSSDITDAEYFLDSDPGSGNGIPIAVAPGATTNFTVSLPTALSPGFHFLAIRTKGSDDQWGLFESRGFYISSATSDAADITTAEYFFDADPGNGNGTAISIAPGATSNFTVSIPTNLSPGFHFLAIRTKGSDGLWGLFEARGFYVSSESVDASNIIAAEYFFDIDPGTGSGTSIPIPSGAIAAFSVNLPATGLTPGFHFLAIRTQGSDGKWGLFETRGFYVGIQTTDSPEIVAAEYFFDTDPGEGNGISVTIDTPGDTVNQTFLAAIPVSFPAGPHSISVRVQTSDGKWSIIETEAFIITDNLSPVANAGGDQTINAPVNSVLLDGTTSNDPDGTINAYLWTKISGPAAGTIAEPTQVSTTVQDPESGTYAFELTVTDNKGATDKDTVFVTINVNPNLLPVADSGPDQIIALPVNNAVLDGTGSVDPDGSIVSFSWTMISGSVSPAIVNPNQSIATVNNLAEGTYQFELVVTDNADATDKDTIQITVNPPLSSCPPVPAITQLGNQLICNPGGVAYQWYNNGVAVEGETNQIYEISVIEHGLYAVEVSSNGCTTRSADFVFLITEKEKDTHGIKFYPNPAIDKVIIETPVGFLSAEMTIIDALGREVVKSIISTGANEIKTGNLSQGIYYIYIAGEFGYKIQKL